MTSLSSLESTNSTQLKVSPIDFSDDKENNSNNPINSNSKLTELIETKNNHSKPSLPFNFRSLIEKLEHNFKNGIKCPHNSIYSMIFTPPSYMYDFDRILFVLNPHMLDKYSIKLFKSHRLNNLVFKSYYYEEPERFLVYDEKSEKILTKAIKKLFKKSMKKLCKYCGDLLEMNEKSTSFMPCISCDLYKGMNRFRKDKIGKYKQEQCCICLNDEVKYKGLFGEMECKHVFHLKCISKINVEFSYDIECEIAKCPICKSESNGFKVGWKKFVFDKEYQEIEDEELFEYQGNMNSVV